MEATAPSTSGTRSSGNSDGNDAAPGDPISSATGEFYFSRTDLNSGGPLPLKFSRYYGSMLARDGNVDSALGNNFMHNFDLTLAADTSGAILTYYNGKRIEFEKTGSNWRLKNALAIQYQMVESGSDFIIMDPLSALSYTFSSTGQLTSISDRNGNTHTLTHSETLLSQVSDGLGRRFDFTYTSGNLTRVQDQGGRILTFTYVGNNLTSFTDAMGNTTTYTYTAAGGFEGLMTSATWPEGNSPYSQTYDSQGRAVTQTDSENNTMTLAFDTPSTGITTVTDPLSNTTEHTHAELKNLTSLKDEDEETASFTYDSNNRRTSLTDRLGDTASTTYHEASGKPAAFTDAMGNVTTLTYTAQIQGSFTFHNLTRMDYPDGTSVTMTYDNSGNLLTHTNQTGNTWIYTYNTRGQILTITNPASGVTTNTYNTDGTLATKADHFSNLTRYTYDSLKRPARITWPDSTTNIFTHDNNSNLLTMTDELGNTTTFTYDRNNNLETVIDPLNKVTTYSYDGNDYVTDIIDELNQTTTITYDALQRPATITNPVGEATRFAYSAQGWLTSVMDSGNKTTALTYDKEGVPASKTDPLLNTETYTTDKLGRTTRVSTALSGIHGYTLDSLGRLTGYSNPLSQVTTYTRDNLGLLTGITLPNAISAAYARNDLGLITQITDGNANTWDLDYDAMGRHISRTDPLANTTTYTYDSRNRIATQTYPEGTLQISYDGTGNITRQLYSDNTDLQFTYDDNDRLLTGNGISLGYDARGDIITSNGITATRDDAGRIATLILAPGKTITYAYNSRGLVSRVSDWAGGSTTLSYDDAGRLSSLTRPNNVITQKTHDAEGKLSTIIEKNTATLSSITLVRDSAGRITSADRNVPLIADPTSGTATNTYNAGNQVTTNTYDKMGRLTADGSGTYTWDMASRLTACTSGGTPVSFTYDGVGMRTSRTSGGITRTYIVNYAIDLPSISIVQQGGSDQTYYVHLPSGMLLYSIDALTNARRFYHYDEMGTTLCLTDDSGAITDSYAVTPYGEITSTSGTTENPFTFIGAWGVMQENADGLYYMRARYYDSNTAAFISHDAINSIEPLNINPYQYANRNPLWFVDFTGLDNVYMGEEDPDAVSAKMTRAINDYESAKSALAQNSNELSRLRGIMRKVKNGLKQLEGNPWLSEAYKRIKKQYEDADLETKVKKELERNREAVENLKKTKQNLALGHKYFKRYLKNLTDRDTKYKLTKKWHKKLEKYGDIIQRENLKNRLNLIMTAKVFTSLRDTGNKKPPVTPTNK